MLRLVAIFLLAATLLPATASVVNAEDSHKVFMYVREGSRDLDLMLKEEIGVMRQMLEDAGYVVDIATPADEPMVADTMTLTPTITLADVAKRPEFANGTFLGTGVIRDGNINTSGICPLSSRSRNLPDGTVGLTQSFIESLNEAR